MDRKLFHRADRTNRIGSRSVLPVLLLFQAFSLSSVVSYGQDINPKLGSTVALNVVLKDELGNDVQLGKLIDKPTILTLNYFRCAGICTPLLNSLAGALNQVALRPGADFQVITVSFDPTDTPEMARQKQVNYLAEMTRAYPPAAWRFLTGPAEATKDLADSVGFTFRKEGDQYIHPGAIMILTPKGVVSRYLYGISFLPADLQAALQDAYGGKIRPTIARMLAVCYSYDPASRGYVFNYTRVVGGATLLFGAVFVLYFVLARRSRMRAGAKEGQGPS